MIDSARLFREFAGWLRCPDCGEMADPEDGKLTCAECGRESRKRLEKA